jgi:hypothetical protein
MIETQLTQLAPLLPSTEDGKILGNLCLLARMFVQCSPDGVSHLGGHEQLTLQGDPYSRFLIHGNLQQLYTERILVIWPSLALYNTRKLGMPSVTLARVSTSCPGYARKTGISRPYPNLEDDSTCWCINSVSGGDCGGSIGICPMLLHLCALICKMMRKCQSFLGGHSYVMLEQGSMWKVWPSVSALGRRTWCSGFNQQKNNAIQCKEMMSRPGGGRSHNPSSHDLWPHQENQGRHGRCGCRYRDHTPLLLRSGVTSGTDHWEKSRSRP